MPTDGAPEQTFASSHALARRLLELPDLTPIAQNDAIRFRLVRVYVLERACWSDKPGFWTEGQPAVVVADFTDTDWTDAADVASTTTLLLPDELPRWVAERIERDGYPWTARDVGPVAVKPTADRAVAFWRECVRLLREEGT